MPKPAIHVFLGAGPGNLHRALALRNIDPDAKFVFIDKRLQPDNPDERIERDRSRANIFRFETDEVTQLLTHLTHRFINRPGFLTPASRSDLPEQSIYI